MTASKRRRNRGHRDPDTLLLIAAGVVITAVIVAYISWRLGSLIAGVNSPFPGNPARAVVALLRGQLQWPIAATVVFAVLLIAAIAASIALAVRRAEGAALRDFDDLAVDMAGARELSGVRARDARKSARRLLGPGAVTSEFRYGLHLGRLVRGPMLYMLWEWVGLIIAGPRSGKTMAYMIPMTCQAPGPVFITSNKSDIYDHTRWVRDAAEIPAELHDPTADRMIKAEPATTVTGARALYPAVRRWVADRRDRDAMTARVRGRIWLADLQNLASDDAQSWWWDPLWRIDDLAGARELAAAFAGAETADSARVDAYFDGGAKELLALYLFAAALGGGDIKHAVDWLTDPKVTVAQKLLVKHGQPDAAAKLTTTAALTEKQRDGLYDMARRFVNVMTVPAYARSVVPPRRVQFADDPTRSDQDLSHNNPQFDPMAFVASTDTLYALSHDTDGAPTALTAALADSVFEAASRRGRRHGGRLRVPLVALLDEAANVCKLTALPKWYSHFGDRGVVVLTVLQSLSQAATVWNHDQMKTLTDASNVYVYGGSSNNKPWLAELSDLIGTHDVRRYSRSSSAGSRNGSSSESWSKEPILGVEDLKALPLERAVLSTSGNRIVATEKNFWWNGPYADLIEASRRACKTARGEDPDSIDDDSDIDTAATVRPTGTYA